MSQKPIAIKSSTTKSNTTNHQPTKPCAPKKQPTKKQQLQDDLEQRFLNPLLRVAIEPEAQRREAEPGWTVIDRLGEIEQYEGFYERIETDGK